MNEEYATKKDPSDLESHPSCFVSVPMNGRTQEEIDGDIARAEQWMRSRGFRVHTPPKNLLERYHEEKTEYPALWWLGTSIQQMAFCRAAFFCAGWRKYRGCRLEYDAAVEYGLPIFMEADDGEVLFEQSILD